MTLHPHPPPGRTPRVVAYALSAVMAAMAAAHALRPEGAIADLPFCDDSFYALSAARHLALGHGLSHDGAQPTNGVQPLWVLLNAGLQWLVAGDRTAGVRLSLALSTGLWLAFAWVMGAGWSRGLPLRDGRDARAVAVLGALGSFAVFREFHNGLETGLTLLLLGVAVRCFDDPRDDLRSALGRGGALSLLLLARLDTVAFAGAAAGLYLAQRRRERGFAARDAVMLAMPALAIAPWLLRNLAIDGHLVPTSGRAESLRVDLAANAWATVQSAGYWALAPLARVPLWHPAGKVAAATAGVVAAALALRAMGSRRERRSVGGAALGLHVAFVACFYTLRFGAPHFQSRYLAPVMLLMTPWVLEMIAKACDDRAARWAAALGAVAVLNVGPMAASLAGATRGGNSNASEQSAWVLAHVEPRCTVGAGQSGTLGYLRDRVVNLDGKVDPRALAAIRAHALREYVDRRGVEVVVDWPEYVRPALGRGARGFHRVATAGTYEAWVRDGSEGCVELTPRQ